MASDVERLGQYSRTRDAEAFRSLVATHQDFVYSVCRRMLGNAADAEDAAQECFLSLAQSAGAIQVSVVGWLHRRATRLCIDRVRKDASRSRREKDHAEMRAQENVDAGGVTWREVAPEIDRALEGLPEETCLALLEHFLRQRSQAEIAETMGLSPATVSRRVSSGVEEIRSKLRKEGVALSVALLATLLTENALAASPPTLVAALGKMAIAGVGERALAGATTKAATAGLAALKTKVIAATVAAVIIVGGAVAYNKLSEKEPKGSTDEPVEAASTRPGGAVVQDASARPEPTVEPVDETRDFPAVHPRVDEHGDSLPPFAVARFGTVRLRHRDSVRSMAFSPDGRVLACACPQEGVVLWDAATGDELGQLGGPSDAYRSVAVSPDGKVIAAGGKRVGVYDARAREKTLDIRFARGPVAFSPDGGLLATGSDIAGPVDLWDLRTGEEARMLPLRGLSKHSRLAFSPSGLTLALSITGEQSLRLRDVRTGAVLWSAGGYEGLPLSLSPPSACSPLSPAVVGWSAALVDSTWAHTPPSWARIT